MSVALLIVAGVVAVIHVIVVVSNTSSPIRWGELCLRLAGTGAGAMTGAAVGFLFAGLCWLYLPGPPVVLSITAGAILGMFLSLFCPRVLLHAAEFLSDLLL